MRGFFMATLVGLLAAAPAFAGDDAAPKDVDPIPRTEIDEVFKRHMNQIRYCYQRMLKEDPTIGGKVTLGLVIGADGTVTSATGETDDLPDTVVDCMIGVAEQLEFPSPANGNQMSVRYPFYFSTGKEAGLPPG